MHFTWIFPVNIENERESCRNRKELKLGAVVSPRIFSRSIPFQLLKIISSFSFLCVSKFYDTRYYHTNTQVYVDWTGLHGMGRYLHWFCIHFSHHYVQRSVTMWKGSIISAQNIPRIIIIELPSNPICKCISFSRLCKLLIKFMHELILVTERTKDTVTFRRHITHGFSHLAHLNASMLTMIDLVGKIFRWLAQASYLRFTDYQLEYMEKLDKIKAPPSFQWKCRSFVLK